MIQDSCGNWIKSDAQSFSLLEEISAIGDVSYVLSQQWQTAKELLVKYI